MPRTPTLVAAIIVTASAIAEAQEPAPSPSPVAAVTAGWKDGFFIQSADGKSKVKIGAYIHADARFLLGDDSGDSFLVRRVRPTFDGTVGGKWDFKFQPDFGQGRTVIQDAYVDAHFIEEVRLRVGKMKQPFGLGRLQSASALTFPERGHPTNLAPNRDIGVQVHGELHKGLLQYQVGLFNGVTDGGSTDGDSDDDKDVVARVFAHPLLTLFPKLKGLGLGGAVSWGKRAGTPAAPQVAPYKTASTANFFSYAAGTTADSAVVAAGEHLRATGQGYFYYGPIGVLGEYVWSRQQVKRGAIEKQLAHQAWGVEVNYVITGENAGYKSVTPKTTFEPQARTWGALEIAARVNQTRIDRDAFADGFADIQKSARRATGFGGVVSWYAAAAFKLSVTFERTVFRQGTAGGVDRRAEDLLGVRVQSVL